jgi:hypothetical protein
VVAIYRIAYNALWAHYAFTVFRYTRVFRVYFLYTRVFRVW